MTASAVSRPKHWHSEHDSNIRKPFLDRNNITSLQKSRLDVSFYDSFDTFQRETSYFLFTKAKKKHIWGF